MPILATSAFPPFLAMETLGDEFILEPGTSYQAQSIAGAGTTPLVALGAEWEE